MVSKPPLVGIVVLLAAGIGLTAFLRSRAEQQRIAEEEAARPLPVQVNVAALGRVEPAGGVIEVASPEQGGVISELLVSAGDAVTGGQILAYLNLYEVRLAERDLAESQLVEAQQQLVAQQQLGSAQIAEANTRVDQVNLPQAEAIEAQNAQIRDLQAQLNLESIDLNRFERLAAQGAISQQQLDSQRAQVAQTQQKIAAAKATLTQLDTARNANLDNAVAQVSAAEADLLLSQANVGVRSAEHNLALAEARLTQSIIRAPSILSVGITHDMQVGAELFETDVGLVEPGQSATIRSRNGAFDEVLTGTVDEVALQIFKNDVLDDDPAANADARGVEVDIVVDQAEVIDALTNLQVDVVIDIEESVAAPDSQSDLVRESRIVED